LYVFGVFSIFIGMAAPTRENIVFQTFSIPPTPLYKGGSIFMGMAAPTRQNIVFQTFSIPPTPFIRGALFL
jgi:hypothetical protein